MKEEDISVKELRYGGGDDPGIGADVGAAYRREGERAEMADRARRQGERAGRVFGKLVARLVIAGTVLLFLGGLVAVAHETVRFLEWVWSWT